MDRCPDVLCDNGNMPDNLLRQLCSRVMPCTSCLDGKVIEDMSAGLLLLCLLFSLFFIFYTLSIIITTTTTISF